MRAADNNQIALFWESGTFGNRQGNAVWIGQVVNHELDEDMGVINARFAGNASRNVTQFLDGPAVFNGTLQYYPQNFRLLGMTLGSMVDGGSPSPFQHNYAETTTASATATVPNQSLPSFQIEDFQGADVAGSHFLRSVSGCMINSFTVTVAEGEPVTCEVGYVAQGAVFTSGAKSSVTALTERPYMWRDVAVFIPSGTQYTKVKDLSVSVNNNLETPHYVDGDRLIGVPIPTNRDYEISLTLNAEKARTKELYEQYFLGGSTFNVLLRFQVSAGSKELFWAFSGCKLVDMSAPSPGEGLNEETITIRPQSSSVIENNDIQYHNLGSYSGF